MTKSSFYHVHKIVTNFLMSLGLSVLIIYFVLSSKAIVSINLVEKFQAGQDEPKVCGRFPNRSTDHWQILKTSSSSFLFYGAYFDDRFDASFIRILAYVNDPNVTERIYCQFWFENEEQPVISKVSDMSLIWPSFWGQNTQGYSPYLMSCESPRNGTPKYVSIVEEECHKAENLLSVYYKPKVESKKDFVVCVKDFRFSNDISNSLIEWFEILKILGVNKVVIYAIDVHANIRKAFKFYEAEKFIEVIDHQPPQTLINANKSMEQHWHNQLSSLNDCFYRHVNEFKFVIPMDVDEFIIPLKPEDRTWLDLFKRIKETNPSDYYDFYQLRNIYFYHLDDHFQKLNPNRRIFHFLDNTLRVQNYSDYGTGSKCFISTESVLTVHNHRPIKCMKAAGCIDFPINFEDAHLSHYRLTCDGDLTSESCRKLDLASAVNDTILWKYKDEFVDNVLKVTKHIALIK